jgi:RimJ/RimL family protein N-acetyltransferase
VISSSDSTAAITSVSVIEQNASTDAANEAQGSPKDARAERGDLRNPDITFRPLRDDDLPLMHRWLNDPAVVQWWEGADVSWPAVVSRYGPGHSAVVEHWIALLAGDPLGWMQCYCAADVAKREAYYWRGHLELRETAGIDYLVGEATRRARGIGSAMIRTFVRDVVFARHPEWAFAAAGPFEANVASWRALEKAGFRRLATLDDEDGSCVLMLANRASFGDDVGGSG